MGARWPTWVFSNHDQPRIRTRLGGSEARARAALLMLLTLRGTPFLYAGEELGLEDAEIPLDRRVDPGGRDGCRAPIPWTAGGTHGWSTASPWLPWPPEPDERSLERLRADETSILHLYRRLLAVRRSSAALREGSIALRDAPDGVLAYERRAGDERWVVAVNFTSERVAYAVPGSVVVASDGAGEGQAFRGVLAPDGAVVARGE